MSKCNETVKVDFKSNIQVRWKEFICGWGAACINITVTYPLNKIIFRQMLHRINVYKAFMELHDEGIYYLYRGMLPPLMQKTISLSIMFGVYEEVRRPLMDEIGINPYLAKATAGIVAGSTEALLMPFERIQTILSDGAYHEKFKNTFHAFKTVGLNHGLKEYYRGFTPILCRNGPSNVCFFILRDEIHLRLEKQTNIVKHTAAEFLCGAIIGVVLSTLFYPLNVVKIAMQSQIGGEYQNMFKIFRHIYKEQGGSIKNFYYGLNASITRSFFSWGVMNAAYQHIKDAIIDF